LTLGGSLGTIQNWRTPVPPGGGKVTDLAAAYSKVKPAVVAIAATRHHQGQTGMLVFGSGFCADAGGVVVTCNHVIEAVLSEPGDYDTAELRRGGFAGTLEPGRHVQPKALFFIEHGVDWLLLTAPAIVLHRDAEHDLAVLLLQPIDDGAQAGPPGWAYPAVSLGDPRTLQEGEAVGAAGFPYGISFGPSQQVANATVAAGVVSAIHPAPILARNFPTSFAPFQLDMVLHFGNSGGPVFRCSDAAVVGVVVDGFYGSGPGAPLRPKKRKKLPRLAVAPSGIARAIPAIWVAPLVRQMAEHAARLRDQGLLTSVPGSSS
jgi:S1-C subfamily serine protease